MSEHTPEGATCVLHPEAAARSVCDRCGAFMCGACSGDGRQTRCPVCRARAGAGAFPLRRDAWRLGALFGIAWRAFLRGGLQLGGALVLIVVLYTAVGYLPDLFIPAGLRAAKVAWEVMVPWSVVDLVIVMGLALGVLDMTFDALDGEPVRIRTLFWHLGKTGRLLLVSVVLVGVLFLPVVAFVSATHVAILLGAHGQAVLAGVRGLGLLGLLGSLWFVLALCLAPLELALDDDASAVEALRRSLVLARGKRWAILGVGVLAWLVGMAGILLLGIGLLATLPFAWLLLSGLFLTLRQGSGLPEPVRRGRRARAAGAPEPVAPPRPAGG